MLFDNADISEIENALSRYNSICPDPPGQPIWAVAENYRFEPAFVEVFVYAICGLFHLWLARA